jgi:hypothetical protein
VAPAEGMPRESGGRATRGPTDQVRARVALRIHCPGVLGAIAQLVEHLLGRQGVRGSNPLSSTEAGPKGSYSNPAEHRIRIRFWNIAQLPPGRALQWLDRACLVDMDHGIELVRHPSPEVVAGALGLRAIDDPDGPLEAGRAQQIGRRQRRARRQS